MKKNLIVIIVLLSIHSLQGQTLSQLQTINARATGYAIVAARNPGVIFSINMIPWDGSNTLEYNANHQINSGWHAQAAVKGNFFSQSFDGNDFSQYSSVVLSEQDFNLYKSTGTQWWIVCSMLPPFSYSINTGSDGSLTTIKNLFVNGTIQSNAAYGLVLVPSSGDAIINRNNPGNLVLSSGSGSSSVRFNYSYGGGSGGIQIFDGGSTNNGTLAVNSSGHLIISSSGGNVGIGTVGSPDARLAVNGQVHATEVRITTTVPFPDYVFEKDYKLPSLYKIKSYIETNKHLPDVPSAKEIEKNGLFVAEMNAKLLQKIEELTLYMIDLKKEVDRINDENIKLKKEIIQSKN